MSRTSFFQPRSSASVMPVVTRSAQPSTPRPFSSAVTKPASTIPSAIVLAWDNVLFPTTWMTECTGFKPSLNKKTLDDSKRTCLHNPFTVQALAAIEQQVIEVLTLATTKAPVFIISNDAPTTINAVCSMFFPRLQVCLTNAHGRVHILGGGASPSATSVDRAAWKQSALQQICHAAMGQQSAHAAVHGIAPFKVLAVSADEGDLQAAARVQAMVARVGTVQTLALPAVTAHGKPLSLVDFHKQLQGIAAALAM